MIPAELERDVKTRVVTEKTGAAGSKAYRALRDVVGRQEAQDLPVARG